VDVVPKCKSCYCLSAVSIGQQKRKPVDMQVTCYFKSNYNKYVPISTLSLLADNQKGENRTSVKKNSGYFFDLLKTIYVDVYRTRSATYNKL